MPEQNVNYYKLGSYEIDVSRRLLFVSDGDAIPLTPKVFDLLLFLVQHPAQMLTKDRIMSAVWPDTIVEESNLTQNISILRRALGDIRGDNAFIVTIPGQGYRFVAEVVTNSDVAAETASATRFDTIREDKPNRTRTAAIAIAVGTIVVALSAIYFYRSKNVEPPGDPSKVLAVLPFKPLVEQDSDQALEIGMADTLIARLGNISGLVLRPLSSVRKFSGSDKDPQSAGRELGVGSVLVGSIQRQGQKIRVTVRLIDVASGKALWAGTFDEQYHDIFSVQDAISARVTEALRLQIRNSEDLSGGGTRDAEAYRLYLQARFFQFKSTPQEIRQAISFYQEAIRIDPNYGLAYAGMADAFRTLPITSDVGPSTAFPESKAAALKALQLEDNLAQAHTALGYVAPWYEWDWKTAETEKRRGVDLDPDSPEAHRGLSLLFTVLGQHKEALDEMKISRELDPLSLPTNALEAQALHYAGRDAEAIDRLNQAFEIDPDFWIARLMLGRIYIGQSRLDDALIEIDRARTASGGNTETTSLIGYVYAKKGNRELALKAIDELKKRTTDSYSPAYNIAMVYNGLGETDRALTALEEAVERRDVRLILLNIDHKWDNLRQHPRFVTILRRLNFGS